ncbi:MAG: RsbRD N-terminal domain-containing protein [Deltaproteobacteria bacterium]|nr:RsbRD N-terminal domain-containing protein [Deltaproteobacteria bacterium]
MSHPATKLADFLSSRKKVILRRWFESIIETYPPDTARFLKKEPDRFANPVGRTVLEGTGAIFDQLLQGLKAGESSTFLDNIIRIRAIQDFSPSQAVAFVFSLKKIIRQELESEIWESGLHDELVDLESSLDELALLAFDIYVGCREKLADIRVKEMRTRTDRILARLNDRYGRPEQEPELSEAQADGPI